MLVSNDGALIEETAHLSTQARDPAPHYEHSRLGYNYRMSNLLATLGRGQLRQPGDRVRRRREIFGRYRRELEGSLASTSSRTHPGTGTRWLTCVTFDPAAFGADREAIRQALEKHDIESRPLWKPLHLQPLYAGCEVVGGRVAERLFDNGLCLPRGSAMEDQDQERVISVIRDCFESTTIKGHG